MFNIQKAPPQQSGSLLKHMHARTHTLHPDKYLKNARVAQADTSLSQAAVEQARIRQVAQAWSSCKEKWKTRLVVKANVEQIHADTVKSTDI